MTTPLNLTLQINLGGMTARVQRLLQTSANLVSIGLNARGTITGETYSLPGSSFQHVFDSSHHWSLEQATTAWERWVLRNAFRDVAEAIGGVLEEAQSVLSYWRLIALQEECGQLKGEDWNEIIVRRGEQFHRRTLPQRIEFLEKTYGFSLESELVEMMLGINAARNCLVHRGGVVGPVDLNGDAKMAVQWRAFVTLLQRDDAEREIEPPVLVEGGSTLAVAVRLRTKEFSAGESISFSAKEFSQMCWTMFLFSLDCAKRLEEYGKARGLEFAAASTQQAASVDGVDSAYKVATKLFC